MNDDSSVLDTALDVQRIRQYFDAVTMTRELVAGIRNDISFLDVALRAVLPPPFDRRRPRSGPAFPPLRVTPAAHFQDRRIAVVASGGSGALSCLIGVARALEESGVRPAAYSLCSGSALFGFPLAAGRSAEEVAEFTLSLRPRDYIDVDWGALATLLPQLGRGFTGIINGEAVERAYHGWLSDMTLGDLAIPAYAPVWNVDHNKLEYIGTRTHPRLPVARAVRMAIALPLFVKPVRYRQAHYCDGGTVDILPVRPVLEIEPPPDAALVVNAFYPHEFAGEDISGWTERTASILYAASQVRSCQHIQLGRDSLARLRREVHEVITVDPVPYSVVSGVGLYREFLETAHWEEFIRKGRLEGLRALHDAAAAAGRPASSRTRRRTRTDGSTSRRAHATGPASGDGSSSGAGDGPGAVEPPAGP